MSKTPAELDREIAEFLAKPQKLNDPVWEKEWGGLLREKHSKARMPTIDELARAFSYVQGEFRLRDERIGAEQWAEGLAYGQRHSIDAEDKHQAKEMLGQLSRAEWLAIAERANYIAREQGIAPGYLK